MTDPPAAAPLVQRRPTWRQDNPRDQLIAVINAARGLADNIVDGTVTDLTQIRSVLTAMDARLEEALQLTGLVSGSWTSSS